jgi:hypothetical protein
MECTTVAVTNKLVQLRKERGRKHLLGIERTASHLSISGRPLRKLSLECASVSEEAKEPKERWRPPSRDEELL